MIWIICLWKIVEVLNVSPTPSSSLHSDAVYFIHSSRFTEKYSYLCALELSRKSVCMWLVYVNCRNRMIYINIRLHVRTLNLVPCPPHTLFISTPQPMYFSHSFACSLFPSLPISLAVYRSRFSIVFISLNINKFTIKCRPNHAIHHALHA